MKTTSRHSMAMAELEVEDARVVVFCLLWLVPYLLSASVALYWPQHDGFLGIDFRAAGWVVSVPSMAAYIEKSSFPSATAAYMALSTVLFLPTFLFALMAPRRVFGASRAWRRYLQRLARWPFALPVSTIAASMLAIWGAWVQPGYQLSVLPLNEHRWALALGGPLFAFPLLSYYLVSSAVLAARLLFVAVEEPRNGME